MLSYTDSELARLHEWNNTGLPLSTALKWLTLDAIRILSGELVTTPIGSNTLRPGSGRFPSGVATPGPTRERESSSGSKKEEKKKGSALAPLDLTQRILDHLNELAGSGFQAKGKLARGLIGARLKEGFTEADFYEVNRKKAAQWKDDPKMRTYLRPKTLYSASNFEEYLGQLEAGSASTTPPSESTKGIWIDGEGWHHYEGKELVKGPAPERKAKR